MLPSVNWKSGHWMRDLFLTGVLVLWLYQLLAPLAKTGGINDVSKFFAFVAVLLLLDLIIPWRLPRVIFKIGLLTVFMYRMFFSAMPFWDDNWLFMLLSDVNQGIFYALQRKYLSVNALAQTFFFMLFLWITASVFRNALGSRYWLFALLFIGEVVIGVIDTFFPFDASGYIVRYFLAGFVLLAFSQLPELEKWARIPEKVSGWPAKWIAWTLLIPFLAVSTGMAAPKYPPAWPDPVSFLQGKAVREGAAGPKRIGYSSTDEALGGGYVMDDTVAFTAITSDAGYYRGESKSYYTGKGWRSVGGGITLQNQTLAATISQSNFRQIYGVPTATKTKTISQEIKIENGRFDVAFAQYQLQDFKKLSGEAGIVQFFNPGDWKLAGALHQGDSYQVKSEVPYYDTDRFKQQSGTDQFNQSGFMFDNLQLPETLPERVKQLALKITADKATVYEKAKAIEEYLRYNYMYETDDVPYPGPQQDFVDQFLFETKRGYCDHFSTSMVILARAAGIPARWVKGFTEGSPDGTVAAKGNNGEVLTKYVVRNRNAHSWPELYISGSGWLPFEPTSGFSQPVVQEVLPAAQSTTQESSTASKPNKPEQDDPSVHVTYEIDWSLIGEIALGAVAVLLIIAALLWRRLLVAFYIRRSYSSEPDDRSTLVQAMERLLTALRLFGLKKQDNLTVREFGMEITDSGYRGNEWSLMSRLFERARYGNKQIEQREIKETRDLWERIVRKIGRTKKR